MAWLAAGLALALSETAASAATLITVDLWDKGAVIRPH